jgi:superfamily II DNA or RNA helicase
MPWEIKQDKPLLFPKTTKAVLYDALYIEKQNLSKGVLNKLQRLSSFSNPEFFVLQNLRKSTFNTPRIITSFDINERYIIVPRGLTIKVLSLFNAHKAKLFIEDKRFVKSIEKLNFTLILKDEQKVALDKILNQDYSVLIAPPGFGKTAVAAAVFEKRSVNTLILVNKSNLLNQWVERLCEYFNIDAKTIGKLGNGKKKLTSNLDISTLQSLKNRAELIEEYSQIIIDEVHHLPAVSFEIPLRKFKGKYVLGLSATPLRKDGMHPIMFMQCGEIAYESKKEIRKIHTLKTVTSTFETLSDDFALMLNEIVEDFDRNNLIISEIEKLKDRNILVLSERIEHLNILYHLLVAKGLKSTLVHGGLKSKMKKEFLKEANTSSIILSTSSFIGEGIDFSHLDAIVLAMPVSYWGRIVQYLGRIGRDGQECIAVDFFDENTPMLRYSFHKRQRGYKKMGYVSIDEKGLF